MQVCDLSFELFAERHLFFVAGKTTGCSPEAMVSPLSPFEGVVVPAALLGSADTVKWEIRNP